MPRRPQPRDNLNQPLQETPGMKPSTLSPQTLDSIVLGSPRLLPSSGKKSRLSGSGADVAYEARYFLQQLPRNYDLVQVPGLRLGIIGHQFGACV